MNNYRVTTHPIINQVQWRLQKTLETKPNLKKYTKELCILFGCSQEQLDFKIPQIIQIIRLGQLSRLQVLEFKIMLQKEILESHINGSNSTELAILKDFILLIELSYLLSENEEFLPNALPCSLSPKRSKTPPCFSQKVYKTYKNMKPSK